MNNVVTAHCIRCPSSVLRRMVLTCPSSIHGRIRLFNKTTYFNQITKLIMKTVTKEFFEFHILHQVEKFLMIIFCCLAADIFIEIELEKYKQK